MTSISLSVTADLSGVTGDMQRLQRNVNNLPDHVAETLGENMTDVVHVITGYLRSTIYNRKNVAGATAEYAGWEAERGGDHDFPQRAIDALDPDEIMEFLLDGVV